MCNNCARGPLGPNKHSYHKQDMTVAGELFGVIVEDAPYEFGNELKPRHLIHIFIEDDELYHYKMCFDAYWIKDLLRVFARVVSYLGIRGS